MSIVIENSDGLSYAVRYPDGFDDKVKYPAIFFLHGAGSRGCTDGVPTALINNPFFRSADSIIKDRAIIFAPHCARPDGTWFGVFEQVCRLTEHIAQLPYVDADRISLMGVSMGGYGAWELAMLCPDRFSCLVPLCGGGMYWNVGRLENLPVWAFHGGKDDVVDPDESRKLVDKVNSRGGNARLTVFENTGHNVWDDVYSMPEVFDWMISMRRNSKDIVADGFSGADKFG